MGSFEVDESGRPVPNAWVPCHRCGEMCPIVVLAGTADDIEHDPKIRMWCEECFVAAGVEALTSAANEPLPDDEA